ncbi:MAG: tRNA 4-thiouridine(8) synthase ThiI [Candidatus Aminicenantes bacterium]|nr:tRNA 4-thiouridine(8) synthase ThiI [Candidatus Aminicenantes bacterium]
MRLKEIRRPGEKKARARTLLLLSGGLDSILAGKILEEQGVEIVGLTFSSLFFGPREAIRAAEEQDWPLIVADITEEEIEIVEHPRYGYGKNMNPCIDCHGQMVRIAVQLLERYQADFVTTGEVLGERPKSQNRQSLDLVEKLGQAKRLVLRPLSAKLLPPTRAEEEGLVDREKLLDISGRSRKRQLELAARYGIKNFPTPAGGCLLTDPGFSQRLKNLLNWRGKLLVEDILLIKLGRLFFEEEAFFVIGRNEQENEKLRKRMLADDVVIHLADGLGPLTVLRFKKNPWKKEEEKAQTAGRVEHLVGNKTEEMIEEEQGGSQLSGGGPQEWRRPALEINGEINHLTKIKAWQAGGELIKAGDEGKGVFKAILTQPAVRKAGLLTIRYSKARLAEKARVVVSLNHMKEIVEFKKEEWEPYL